MFDHLDEIPWQRLRHAYGSAEVVPSLLCALARSDQRQDALRHLFGTIWHQGTVYEASAYAVPFLFELVSDSTIAGRDEILGLIGALADGRSYLAVHAQEGPVGNFWRAKPDFAKRLAEEEKIVRRTRGAVLEHRDVLSRLLEDAGPMVRAGAAHVLSRFPEHVSEFGLRIREAAASESDPLALAAMLWCLGAIGDAGSEAEAMLTRAVRESADHRQTFAAAIALYRIKGQLQAPALPVYRQMAAARWFLDEFLAEVPWDFSAEVEWDELLAGVEPDPVAATRTLLAALERDHGSSPIVHDLLCLNFSGGNWRQRAPMTDAQKEILRRLVEADSAWIDFRRLWFLVREGGESVSQLKPSDIQEVRDEMRSILRPAEAAAKRE